MQHLVTFVAGIEQSFGGLPRLRWLVAEELVSDDLVHRQMELRIHYSTAVVDLVSPVVDGRMKLWMFGQDQNRTVVLVVGVEQTQLDAVKLAALRRHSEQTPLFVGHTADASQPLAHHVVTAVVTRRAAPYRAFGAR